LHHVKVAKSEVDIPVENTTKGDEAADGDSRPCLASLLGLAERCPSNSIHFGDWSSQPSFKLKVLERGILQRKEVEESKAS
jgi:hypothetical protein